MEEWARTEVFFDFVAKKDFLCKEINNITMKDFQKARTGSRTEYRAADVKVIELNTQGLICLSQNGTLDNGMTRTPGAWE